MKPNFITRFFSKFVPKWSKISSIDRQIDNIERVINSESTDLKAMLPKQYKFRSNASVYEIMDSVTKGMKNHLHSLKGEFDSKTVLLHQNFKRYTELVLPQDKTVFLESEEERRLHESRLDAQRFYTENLSDFENGILAEEIVANNRIQSNELKGTILQSEIRLKQIENENISVVLKNNLVKQTLDESENDALKSLYFVEKHNAFFDENDKNEDKNNSTESIFSKPLETSKNKISDSHKNNHVSAPVTEITESIYPKIREYSAQKPSFTDYHGLPYDFMLISSQLEKEREYSERFAESRIPPFPDVAIGLEMPKDITSKLSPIKEIFLLVNVKKHELILVFVLLIFGLAVEYNAMGSVLTNIFFFSGWKAVIAGSTILILSKLLSYLMAGSVKEFLAREAKILNWRNIKVNKMMVFVVISIFIYSLSIGFLFSKSTERTRKVQEVSMLQNSIQNSKDQAEFSDSSNPENQKSIQQKEKQLEKKQKELENNGMDVLTITAISLSGFLILLASALLFAIVGILLSSYSLRLKIEKLNNEIHSIYSEFSAQKSSIHHIYQKAARIIKLYGILEYLNKQKDYNVDQTQVTYWNSKKEDSLPNSNKTETKNPLPLRSEIFSQNGIHSADTSI